MQPRKFKLFISTFPYGGNGQASSEHPDVRDYLIRTIIEAKADPRIDGNVMLQTFSDTPITMTRNRSVVEARKAGADLLMMVDSDQSPDLYLGHPLAKPFFHSSLDFIENHYDKGPVAIFAPYCGPSPEEIVHVFHWRNMMSNNPNDTNFSLEAYTREHAAIMAGIQECAAAPTGHCIWDMRCFDVTEPEASSRPEMNRGWFYYEWENRYASEKASTEDVTATRDLAILGIQKLGYNPLFCNWDAWAGHWKPNNVGKPVMLTPTSISEKFLAAARHHVPGRQQVELKASPEIAKLFREAKDGKAVAIEDVKLAAVNGD